MSREFIRSEEGVTEVVGEMLLLAITVTVVAILSVVAFGIISGSQSAPIIDMTASLNGNSLVIQHSGGDRVSYGDLSFIINGVEYNSTSPSIHPGDVNHDGTWSTGKSISIDLPQGQGNTTLAIYDNKVSKLLGSFTIGG